MITTPWRLWKQIAQKVGNLQARILLTVFYSLLMFPFGIAVRLLFDPLRVKRPPAEWSEHPEETQDFRWARRQ
jgi:hypothetical protein